MKDIFTSIRQQDKALSPWIDKLVTLFKAMDNGYAKAAGRHGFVCRGCEDNCCQSRFYHHTLLEYMSIYRGYSRLAVQERRQADTRAEAYCRQHAEADAAGTKIKAWCPLNENGRCLIYDLRPMICRLHGIPHMLRQPGGRTVQGPGCECFGSLRKNGGDTFLDRTPFYSAMAGLEKEFRAALEADVKFKQTIAEMILSFLAERSGKKPGDDR